MGASNTLLEFRCTGGRAGNDEYLVVGRDGHATRHQPDGTQ
jgi:hypothetical protein